MSAASHRRYALLGLAFAAVFVVLLARSWTPVPALALLVLAVVFYVSSFARAWSDVE